MSTTIGTTIAGTIASATGDSTQGHLFWAVNDAAWWLIYQASGDTTHFLTYRSPDGTTWTAKNTFAVTTLTADSRLFAVAYKNISSNDVVHVFHCHGTNAQRHTRATISGAQITWGTDSSIGTQTGATNPTGAGCAITGDGHIVVSYNESGDVSSYLSSNADSGSAWTLGFGGNVATDTSIANSSFQSAPVACDTGSKVVFIYENGGNGTAATSATNFLAKSRNGATLAPVVGTAGISVFTAFTARSSNSYGVARIDDTHVHVVAVTGSNTLVHKIVNANGAGNPSISSGASITNQNVKAATGVALVQDGTNLYAVIIDSDAANTVRYCKYNGSTWGTWTALETTTKTRNFLTAAIKSDGSALLAAWSETNGSNFDIVVASASLSSVTNATLTISCSAAGGATVTKSPSAIRSASGVGGGSLVKAPARILLSSAIGAGTVLKSPAKPLSTSAIGSASLLRQQNRTVSATATGAASLVRSPLHLLLAVATGAASVLKSAAHIVSATATGAASLLRSQWRTVSASATGSAVLIRAPLHVLPAIAIGVGSLVRSISRTLSATAAGAGTVVKLPKKILSAAATGSATVTALVVHLFTVACSAVGAASLVKKANKILSASADGSATVKRSLARILTAAVTGTAAVVRLCGKSLSASAAGAASIVRKVNKVLAAVSSGIASVATSVISGATAFLVMWFRGLWSNDDDDN